MNVLKRKLAERLERMSKEALAELDQESPSARTLLKMKEDGLLSEDIQRFCSEISTLEAGRSLRLYAQSLVSSVENGKRHREEMQSLARKVIGRVEKRGGSLNLPPEYMGLLLEA